MFWLIAAVLLPVILLFCKITAKITTIPRKRYFYEVKIYFLGIRVYRTVLCFRLKGYIDPQLLIIRKTGYSVLTDIKKSRERRRKVRRGEALDTGFLISSLKVDEGRVDIAVGTEDAAQTALLCEGVRAAADTVLKLYDIDEIKVTSRPNFEKVEFSVWVDCILSSFAAQIIYKYFKQKGGS